MSNERKGSIISDAKIRESIGAFGPHIHVSGLTSQHGVTVKNEASEGATSVDLTGTAMTGMILEGQILRIDGTDYYAVTEQRACSSNAVNGVQIEPVLKKTYAAGTEVEILEAAVAV